MAGVIEKYAEHHLPVTARHAFIPLMRRASPDGWNLVAQARKGKDAASARLRLRQGALALDCGSVIGGRRREA
jgi:hypothetical protein